MVEVRVYDVEARRTGARAVYRASMDAAVLLRDGWNADGYVTLLLPVGAVAKAQAGRDV